MLRQKLVHYLFEIRLLEHVHHLEQYLKLRQRVLVDFHRVQHYFHMLLVYHLEGEQLF